MPLTIKQIRFCANEVQKQGRDAIAVGDMCAAWLFACNSALPREDGKHHYTPTLFDIIKLGHLVEPEALNFKDGFRSVEIRVGTYFPPKVEDVPERMTRYAEFLTSME